MANFHRHIAIVLGHQDPKQKKFLETPSCSPSQTMNEHVAPAPAPSEPRAMRGEGTVSNEAEAETSEAEWPQEEAGGLVRAGAQAPGLEQCILLGHSFHMERAH